MAAISTKNIASALLISIIFVVLHTLFTAMKLGDTADLVFSLLLMLAADVAAYLVLLRAYKQNTLPFIPVLLMIGTTQAFIVILLALNSAYNPLTDTKPLVLSEILMSLIIFAIVLPLLITTVIWFAFTRRRNRIF